MAIIGFNFTSINAEKEGIAKGSIKISNEVTIKNVEEINLSLGKAKEKALKFMFEFISKYEPAIGKISIKGEILDIEDPKKTKEILKEWKKSKKVPKEVMTVLLNNILTKCNIKALVLSQDMNLPPPIPLPSVRVKNK